MITITGGIISRQNGSTVTYKLKCNSCAFEDQIETTITLTKGVTEITTQKCPNCAKVQIIKMKIAELDKVRSL